MLTKGIGRFSKVLQASEILLADMDLATAFRVLQVDEIEASSAGCNHGKIRSAHWKIAASFSLSSVLQNFSIIRRNKLSLGRVEGSRGGYGYFPPNSSLCLQ